MGEVYRAENQVTGRQVALKVISREATRGADFVERFKLEARVMSELEHPGIVRVHHAGEAGGRYYLTMDLVEGGTLEEWESERRTSKGKEGKGNTKSTENTKKDSVLNP
jgi:serine/threonine protein kinase